jgi:hypothetical protein
LREEDTRRCLMELKELILEELEERIAPGSVSASGQVV